MARSTPTITATRRDQTGTRYSRRLRQSGKLPAVVYGHKRDPVHITVDEIEAVGHLRDGAHVVNLNIDGAGEETCLVKDLQFGFLGDDVIHIDFARVDLDEEVEVKVHLHFVGAAPDAGKAGTILSHDIVELDVICKVRAIPEEIRVDLTKMKADRITVADLEMPEGVRTEVQPTALVAHMIFIQEEVAATAEAADVTAAAPAEPEVITEAKPKEGEEEEEK